MAIERIRVVSKPSNHIAVKVPQARGQGMGSGLRPNQYSSLSLASSDFGGLHSYAGSDGTSDNLTSGMLPTIHPYREGSKLSELDLPNHIYKDFKANYQREVPLEKFILLKMKEFYKENKQLRT